MEKIVKVDKKDMSTSVIITDDGVAYFIDLDDWRFLPDQEKLERGDYEPKLTQEIEGDKVKVTITQEMMPLVKRI